MNIYFKKSLGMTDAFMLTWDELDRINEVCDDYFIFRGYEIDDKKPDDMSYSHITIGGIALRILTSNIST